MSDHLPRHNRSGLGIRDTGLVFRTIPPSTNEGSNSQDAGPASLIPNPESLTPGPECRTPIRESRVPYPASSLARTRS
jgi:hypothetical protein